MCLLCVDGKTMEGVSNLASATHISGKLLDAIHSAYLIIHFLVLASFTNSFIHHRLCVSGVLLIDTSLFLTIIFFFSQSSSWMSRSTNPQSMNPPETNNDNEKEWCTCLKLCERGWWVCHATWYNHKLLHSHSHSPLQCMLLSGSGSRKRTAEEQVLSGTSKRQRGNSIGMVSRLDIVRHQIVMVEWWIEYLNKRKGREMT